MLKIVYIESDTEENMEKALDHLCASKGIGIYIPATQIDDSKIPTLFDLQILLENN